MKKINSLKVITLVLMIMLAISVSSRVFADDTPAITTLTGNNTNQGNTSIGTISDNTTGNGTTNTNTNNTNNTNNAINNTNVATNLPTTNNSTSTSDSLPKAGLSSSSTIIFLIIATSISAIYTYKKVKEYNL